MQTLTRKVITMLKHVIMGGVTEQASREWSKTEEDY